MFLYANGDSFVAGDELNFYKLSGYPGDLKDWPKNREPYKKWLNTHFGNDPNLEDNIVATQHIESFPQKIATYINCDVENNAKGGSSMTRIVRTTLQDLLFYKKKHQNIIALIGIPLLGGREEISSANNEWHQIQIFNEFNEFNDRINEYIKYKLEYETDYHKINQQLRELIQLQNFCKVLDIKLLFVEFDNFFINVKKYCEYNDINLFLQHLDTPYYSMTEAKNKAKKPYSILGHYSREVHTLAANDIIKQMVKLKWIS